MKYAIIALLLISCCSEKSKNDPPPAPLSPQMQECRSYAVAHGMKWNSECTCIKNACDLSGFSHGTVFFLPLTCAEEGCKLRGHSVTSSDDDD